MTPRTADVRLAQNQYVLFRLGVTRFAVPILQTLRIVRLSEITRVPRAPAFLEGVINFQGQAVPVVDLRKRLALPAVEQSAAARILIVELEGQIVGMLVDAVDGILRLPPDALRPPPEMVAEVNGVYLTGVAEHDAHLIVVLDLRQVLTVEEAARVDAWAAELD